MKKFASTFDSLRTFECPEWFRDVKFGIWSHWGPQSVPMFGDWYARRMYIQGSAQNLYHTRHYGHPSKFGYKDICALWKAEKFDPEELMELYYKAGARYFATQATHHDNFFNYDSKVNRFNSVKIGPGKDICALWQKAAKKYDMYFGLTEHLSASFSWWNTNKYHDNFGAYKDVPYDGSDPEYSDFYYNNHEHATDNGMDYLPVWHTANKSHHDYWLRSVKEMIDTFKPDFLYSDGVIPFGPQDSDEPINEELYKAGLEAISHLYNTSIAVNGQNNSVYFQKDRRPEVYNVGVLDIEKSQLDNIADKPWHTDTCIGNWFYDVWHSYKEPGHVIEMLVDIISKNGTMLLNILQKPDGTIDDEALFILKELEKWFNICSEAVYNTRPWRVANEGDTKVLIDGFTENRAAWTASDFRFVKKGNIVYAFILKASEDRRCVIKSFLPDEHIKSVRILGGSELEFAQNIGILAVKLPVDLPTYYTNCIAIELG